MERGRTELLRDMGFELSDLHDADTLFVVAEAQVKYHFSARYNDVLNVATSIVEHSSATLVFHYEITNQNNRLCVSGNVKAACVGKDGKVKKIPKEIIDILDKE
jgi:acyl-CoA thioester hydrolase